MTTTKGQKCTKCNRWLEERVDHLLLEAYPSEVEGLCMECAHPELIVTCTDACIAGEGMGPYADKSVWHHMDCPNHTTACCPGRK
jgi:hypothetical protein